MYQLTCKEMGHEECPFVAEGESQDEVAQKLMAHGKETHGMTDADFTDEAKSKMMGMIRQSE